MTQEEKELLIKDLCTRLPYGIKCKLSADGASLVEDLQLAGLSQFLYGRLDVIPYLRPMSSMTEEEKVDYVATVKLGTCIPELPIQPRIDAVDWLNKHHLDYRGLIEKGLALEAPEEMYES